MPSTALRYRAGMSATISPPSLTRSRRPSWLLASACLLLLATLAPITTGCAGTAAIGQQHHTIDYIELTVTDLAAAKSFYGAAFGWQFTDYGPDYAGIQKTGGGEVGGIRQDSKVRRGGPLLILYSDDLEQSVQAVRDAGGKIVKDPFEFPGGRRFHFLDPAGNELAVWSSK